MGDGHLRDGIGDDRLLEEPTEDQPAAARGPAVEPEGELLQVGLKVTGIDRALVGAEDPAFQQAGDTMNAWNGDVGGIAG